MIKSIISSFRQALENIRANFFHTFLSILGIVIGVAALVSILSLIDGMEKFANEQISNTTDLKVVGISTLTSKVVNNVRIPKDTFPILYWEDYTALLHDLPDAHRGMMSIAHPEELALEGHNEKAGAFVNATTPGIKEAKDLAFGQLLTEANLRNKDSVAVIDHNLAKQLADNNDLASLLHQTITTKDFRLKIIGILKETKSPRPMLEMPISLLPKEILQADPPDLYVEATAIEKVPALKTQIESWLKNRFPKLHQDFEIATNDFRVKQVAEGFLLFRVVMGLIVGISILVGGIGVMNVLLISVTERTSEIGIRKAMGANKSDIMRLFLSESIMVSLLGSLLGLTFGVLFTMAAVPIVKAFTEIPFQAAYTWNTFFIITIIAVLIGVIFGTYPAMKAARLDPVEAIRRE